MRRRILFLLLLPLCGYSRTIPPHLFQPPIPTAGTYFFMADGGVTNGAGISANGHQDEVEIQNTQGGVLHSFGSSITASPITFNKFFDLSSLRIQNQTFAQTGNYKCEIRVYDGVSATPVFKIAMDKIHFTSSSSAFTDCSSGCPGIYESYTLEYGKITTTNYKVTPNQVLVYDVLSNTFSYTQ